MKRTRGANSRSWPVFKIVARVKLPLEIRMDVDKGTLSLSVALAFNAREGNRDRKKTDAES